MGPDFGSYLYSEIAEVIEPTGNFELMLDFAATSWMLKHRAFSKRSYPCSNCTYSYCRISANISECNCHRWVLSLSSPTLCYCLVSVLFCLVRPVQNQNRVRHLVSRWTVFWAFLFSLPPAGRVIQKLMRIEWSHFH